MLDLLHQLTDWFIGFAESDWAVVVLAVGSFLESTISPLPIDPLLIPMGVLQPNFAIFFAVVALISSVLGALVGYWIGKQFRSPVLRFFVSDSKIHKSELMFKKHGMWAILVAAVTPIPYKVFTILGGALKLPLKTFIWASIVGRGIRFLSLGILIFIFGEEIQIFVEDQFKSLSIAFGLGVVAIAIVVWISMKSGLVGLMSRRK